MVALDRTASCFGAARTESRLTAEGLEGASTVTSHGEWKLHRGRESKWIVSGGERLLFGGGGRAGREARKESEEEDLRFISGCHAEVYHSAYIGLWVGCGWTLMGVGRLGKTMRRAALLGRTRSPR